MSTELPLQEEYRHVTEALFRRMFTSGTAYLLLLLTSLGMMGVGALAWGVQLRFGMGVAGYTHPVMWAIYISSFVWWIGIAHSGTLVSAILYLFRAKFRTAFARSAEAMTLIAIITAAAFPIIHLGRAWRFYWLLPYPNQRHLWPTFRSPLILDVFAVVAYLTVSALFFWLGLLPDLAVVRDRLKGWGRTLYGLASLGWEGTLRQWKHHHAAYGLLAGLATPLVISVHSIVSWDFALAVVPGWHSTLFPPYFVIGAVFSGLGMVLTLVIPLRAALKLEEWIKPEHLDRISQLILAMSLLLTFCYGLEYGMTLRYGEEIDRANLLYKVFGAYAVPFWVSVLCNSVVPLALCSPRVRRSPWLLFPLSLLINLGMWLERFVIVLSSLGRDYLPYTWSPELYRISLVEWSLFIGSLGWFLFCYLLFVRYLPLLPIAELKRDMLKEQREQQALRQMPAEDAQ